MVFNIWSPKQLKSNIMKIERTYFSKTDILKCQWLMQATFTLIDDSFLGSSFRIKLNCHDTPLVNWIAWTYLFSKYWQNLIKTCHRV